MTLRYPVQALVDGRPVVVYLTEEQREMARGALRKAKIRKKLTRGRGRRRKRGHLW